jgi:hypothetical protein
MPVLGPGLDVGSDTLLRLRELTLSTYHNLPNTIFVTLLLLGAIQGNLPMIWVGVGMVGNALTVTAFQELLTLILDPSWSQLSQPLSSTCSIIPDGDWVPGGTGKDTAGKFVTVAPSHWFAATTYFIVFILYNAIQVAMRPIAKGADPNKVDVRLAFTMSVISLSTFFFAILLLRGFTGCETWLGSILGILVGSGVAIGYWHLLDMCHSGVPPDILNVVAATAPARDGDETPVICT